MRDTPVEDRLPPSLRFLRALVIVLMISMIGGVLALVWVVVTRLPAALNAAPPALPTAITLPDGETPAALTFGKGWVAVVTEGDRLLIYGTDGALWQQITITRP